MFVLSALCRGAHSESSMAGWLFCQCWQPSRACSILASAPPDGRTIKSIYSFCFSKWQGYLPRPCGVHGRATWSGVFQKLSPISLQLRSAGHCCLPGAHTVGHRPGVNECRSLLLSRKELGFPRCVIFFSFVEILDLLLFSRRSPHSLGYRECIQAVWD